MATNRKISSINTSTWLTRNEASDLCTVSVQTLKNYERRGILHPVIAPRPDSCGYTRAVTVYDPKELAKLPRWGRAIASREPGEIAARCFELLSEGRSVNEIVMILREAPDKINQLREQWFDGGGADFVISPDARAAIEQHLGAFATVADLVERVGVLAQRMKSAA